MSKKFYAIFHGYDTDGGFGDAIPQETMMGIVEATEEEIEAFIKKWDKPIVYDHPYADLCCHHVYAQEIQLSTLDEIKPYGEDDYFGTRAKRYEYDEKFEAEHGHSWYLYDKDEALHELYQKGLDAILCEEKKDAEA